MNLEMRWVQSMEWAEERKIYEKCKKFPDCDCTSCHDFHVDIGEFNKHCGICVDEKCPKCNGKGWKQRIQCKKCEGLGRLKENKSC